LLNIIKSKSKQYSVHVNVKEESLPIEEAVVG